MTDLVCRVAPRPIPEHEECHGPLSQRYKAAPGSMQGRGTGDRSYQRSGELWHGASCGSGTAGFGYWLEETSCGLGMRRSVRPVGAGTKGAGR